ncbi:hypothetical protein [Bradyrhizobium sp. 930_D9_N1_4]|uniref:hypothetical protein n=1 Tax=Bradyrhizobium sp. 930_D9_N1_4 TaxID=3240374 RepID=UPI003F8C8A78
MGNRRTAKMPSPGESPSGRTSSETAFVFIPKLVCPGDILLTRVPLNLLDPSTLTSTAIRVGSRTPFSHAALCIEPGLMIEAVGTGVCRFALAPTGVRSRSNLKLLRLNLDVVDGPWRAQLAADRGHQYLSRGYSLSGAIGARIAAFRKKGRGDLFCSELVAQAYVEAKCPLLTGKTPGEIAPGDLLKSDILRDVTDLALRAIRIDSPLMYYLDDGSHFERTAHWEVRTKLKILQSEPVQRELAALGVSAQSFFDLEKVLRNGTSPDLDRAVHDELVRHDFCGEYMRRRLASIDIADASEIAEAAFVARFEPNEDQLARLDTDSLNFLKQDSESSIISFQNDVMSRKADIQTWARYRGRGNSLTFDYLTALQQPLLDVSEQLLGLFRKDNDCLAAEQRKRAAQ